VRAYGGAILACLVFLLVVRATALFGTSGAVSRGAMQVLHDLRNAALDDDAKEALMRRHTLALGRLFLRILGSAGLALGIPLALLWLADRAGVLSLSAVLAVLASWQFLVGATVVIGSALLFIRRKRVGS
jgi:hypothetical protein